MCLDPIYCHEETQLKPSMSSQDGGPAPSLASLTRKYVSESALGEILQKLRGNPDIILGTGGLSRSSVKRKREREVDIDGPLGPVLRVLHIGEADHVVQAPWLDPAGFLDLQLSRAQPWRELFMRKLQSSPLPWRLLVYLDEITPGNQAEALGRILFIPRVWKADAPTRLCMVYALAAEA